MREGCPNHRYIRVEDKIDSITKGDISLGQMIGDGTIAQAEIQDKFIKVIGPEEVLRGIIGKIAERGIEVKGIVITSIEIEIDQGREHLQETIEETEVIAMTALDQGLEQVQTGIELGVACVENMITLQEIVLALEKKEIWNSCNIC